jgi:hypothetical protein
VVDKLGHLTQELIMLTSASSFWSNWKKSVTSIPFALSPFVFSVLSLLSCFFWFSSVRSQASSLLAFFVVSLRSYCISSFSIRSSFTNFVLLHLLLFLFLSLGAEGIRETLRFTSVS